jgi:tetratricopeptide (TPR) repeat protein
MAMINLALVVIARNESRCIARCLRSARRFVDQMIVLDTGSTDDTVEIARKLGARVHHFAWVDDFSAARNAALEYSSARWNLILDADEWIGEPGASWLGTTLKGLKPFIGLLSVKSELEVNGQVETAATWIPRILPRGVRYRGRIHEQPASELDRRRVVGVPILHDGYRLDAIEAKKGRNEALLLRALEDEPDNAYLMYHLGKAYALYGDHTSAATQYRRALALTTSSHPFRHNLVVQAMSALMSAKCHEEAIDLAQAEMQNWPDSPTFFFALGNLLLEWAELDPPARFQELLPMVEDSWLKCLAIGDQPGLDGSVKGYGSHLAAHNLALLYRRVGNADKEAHYRQLAAVRTAP